MSFNWTAECTTALNEYVAAGVTHLEIARLLNEKFGTSYSRSSVGKKLERLKAPKIPRPDYLFWPPPVKARLIELYNSANQISLTDITAVLNNEFGCAYTRNAIIGCCRRLGLKGKPPTSSANKRPRLYVRNTAPRKLGVAKPKPELPLFRCVELEPLHVSFADLETGMCKQPFGEEPSSFTFCGHPQKDGSSYCGYHHGKNYDKPKPVSRQGRKYHGTDFARRSA